MILDLDRLITFNSKRLFQKFRLKKSFLHVLYFLSETSDLDCGQPYINTRAELTILNTFEINAGAWEGGEKQYTAGEDQATVCGALTIEKSLI